MINDIDEFQPVGQLGSQAASSGQKGSLR